MKNTFYVTTPIYYTSGEPHLGHAYTSIAADIIARWNRIKGNEVFFLTGTDEHGQKVQKKAEENDMSPKDYVDSIIPHFKKQLDQMNISYNYFIRTTYQHHIKYVQDMLNKAYYNGDIYKDYYEGLYCVDCEHYYKEGDLAEGKLCPIHKRAVDEMKEENYFFRLSKYESKLLELYENSQFLSPSSKAQETINRVKEGLQDISISRNKNTLTWGITLPFDKNHVTYVWFDALFNYLSGLEYNDKLNYWPADVHIVGKDIMWFHNVYWPAFLMSCGYEVPKKVFSHGWWTVNNEKMGKSMGNIIDPLDVMEQYGVDELRYFLFSIGTFGEDQDFSYEKLADKINNELNNDLGNLVSRVHAMTNKYFQGNVPRVIGLEESDKRIVEKLNSLKNKFDEYMDDLEYYKALDCLWGVIRDVNAYVNESQPWKVENEERLKTIINILVSSIKLFSSYIRPFMPTKADLINKQFNFENFKLDFEYIEEGLELKEKMNLFSKVKDENKIDSSLQQKKGFSKLQLKVGEILDVKQHPKADKLYIERVDVGEDETRNIVSGLKGVYLTEELIGRKVIVVSNLKPVKLRGEMSQGMILLAEDEDSNLGLLQSDASVGTYLKCGEEIANNDKIITIDDFFEIELFSKGGFVEYNGQKIIAGDSSIEVENNIKGKIR